MDKENATLELSSHQHQELLNMSKYSAVSQSLDAIGNEQNSRVNKTDEMYKDIVDRVNKSREYLESMQKSSAFNENNSEQRIRTDPDALERSSVQTFGHDERKKLELPATGNISSPISSTKVLKKSSGATTEKAAGQGSQKQLFKRDAAVKGQTGKAEETTKAPKKSDAKALNKSRSPQKPETPKTKTKTTLKSTNLGGSKTTKPDLAKAVIQPSQSKVSVAEREEFFQEKYVNLKLKSNEMKNILEEYVDKCITLEDILKEKDQQLQDYQSHLRESQNDRIQSLDTLREFAKKEEHWIRTERELRLQNVAREEAELSQKKKLEELDFLVRRNEQKLQLQAQSLQPESRGSRDEILIEQNRVLEALRVELEAVRKESRQKDSRILELESGDNHRNQDVNRLKDQLDTLERSNRVNASKVDELRENKTHLEEKVSKLKRKLEDERNRLQAEKKADADEKKDKIRRIKSELKESEALVQKLTEEKKILEFEVEKQANVNAALERTLERSKDEIIDLQQKHKALSTINENLKAQNEELFKNYQSECDKAVLFQVDLKKTTKLCQQAEEKLELKEKDSGKVDEMVSRLRGEIKLLLEENAKNRDYANQLESTVAKLKSQQDDEVEKIEIRISDWEQQLQRVKEENALLKASEMQIFKELEIVKEERDRLKKETRALKQVNLTLEKDFKAIDLKVREFMQEREQVLQTQHEKALNTKSQVNSKLRTLDDIQSLIRTHRLYYKTTAEYSDLLKGK